MRSLSRKLIIPVRNASICTAVALLVLLVSATASRAQGRGAVNSAGTFGNEVIQGQIYFPKGERPSMRLTVRLQGDSAGELVVAASPDGTFSFTRLRPDTYTITVNGGDNYESATETVSVGSAGPVPAQGAISNYTVPVVYQVQIYLQPKRATSNGLNPVEIKGALAEVPEEARGRFNKALEFIRRGESLQAIEQLKAAITQAPGFLLAYNEMGVQYLKLGKADQAALSFEAALKIAADQWLPRLNYGIALLNLKRFAEAETQLRLVVEKNEASPTAHFYLGLALMNQQKYEAAQAEFESALRNSSGQMALAHKYLGGIYWRNKDYMRAASELEKYVKLNPKAPDAGKIRQTIKELRDKRNPA